MNIHERHNENIVFLFFIIIYLFRNFLRRKLILLPQNLCNHFYSFAITFTLKSRFFLFIYVAK